jgi:hypothetical protein
MDHRIKKNIVFLIAALFVILLIVDRYYWAQISQWREDQATSLWLGYTAGLGHMPVGLISSKYIPNPNGMILAGSLLSLLPSLLSVSLLLGISQIFLLSLVTWKSFGRDWQYFLLSAVPVLSSVILRSTSVEYWNQYAVTLINMFFLFWVMRYLEKPSLWNLPPIAILILLAPSLYLAGVVNALVMSIIALGVMLYRRPEPAGLWLVLTTILGIALVSLFLTWLPYFQNVSLSQLADYNKQEPGLIATLQAFWESLFGLPIYGTFQWADQTIFTLAFKHADEGILTQWSKILLRLVGRAYLLQAVFAFAAFSYTMLLLLKKVLSRADLQIRVHRPALRLVTLSMLFISLSFAFSTWLGGPNWLHSERPDQIVQFLPMFLFFIFLLPRITTLEGRVGETILAISYFSLLIFAATNLLCGWMILRDHLLYRGSLLSEADVPLIFKMQAIDFIARDWKQVSDSALVPVDYDLDRGIWEMVSETEPALLLEEWYPASLTEGRGFDYDLLRRYGLMNSQEGTQLRTFGNGRYLVTYEFEDPPKPERGKIEHHIFGRLRVSIVE